jgi:6-pyruvoyltetrahydropterin/6-carboxytetrahydropterin synthase
MAGPAHRIVVAKEAFKFSCAHMTVFPDGTKERLHGHNYFVKVALDLRQIAWPHLVDFGPLKQTVAALCLEWKERTLLAAHNPHFQIVSESAAEIEFRLCDQRYVMPRQDVVLVPVDNIIVEALASFLAGELITRLEGTWPKGTVYGIEVRVSESPGQEGVYYRPLDVPA